MTILIACALTIVIEVPFLALTVSKNRDYLIVAAAANALTNLTLNYTIWLFQAHARALVYPLETAAVIAEYLIYRAYLQAEKPKRLFLKTLLANIISYTIGILLYGHI